MRFRSASNPFYQARITTTGGGLNGLDFEGRPRNYQVNIDGEIPFLPDDAEGVLEKISGVGVRSVGTVVFEGSAGTRKFILGHGAVEPVDS